MGFIWDDHFAIEANPTLRHWSPENLKSDFQQGYFRDSQQDFYRPLQTFSNRLNYTLSGLHPFGYHLTNLLFHGANALLLFEIALLLGLPRLGAWLGVSMFSAHPLIVQELLMVSGRSEIMGFTFMLATTCALLQARPRTLWTASLWFVLGLLSKESVVILPLVLTTIYWAMRKPRREFRFLVPLFLFAALYPFLYVRILPMNVPSVPWARTISFFFHDFPVITLHYLKLIAVPWPLYSDRAIPSTGAIGALGALALLILLGSYAVRSAGRWGLASVTSVLLLLLPKAPKMILGGLALDHWGYPLVPWVVVPVGVLMQRGLTAPSRGLRRLTWAVFGIALIGFIGSAQTNIALRNTDERFFRWSTQFRTSRAMVDGLGSVLLREKRAEAVPYFESLHAQRPSDLLVACRLAMAYWQSGRRRESLELLNHLVREHPQDPLPREMLSDLGRTK